MKISLFALTGILLNLLCFFALTHCAPSNDIVLGGVYTYPAHRHGTIRIDTFVVKTLNSQQSYIVAYPLLFGKFDDSVYHIFHSKYEFEHLQPTLLHDNYEMYMK